MKTKHNQKIKTKSGTITGRVNTIHVITQVSGVEFGETTNGDGVVRGVNHTSEVPWVLAEHGFRSNFVGGDEKLKQGYDGVCEIREYIYHINTACLELGNNICWYCERQVCQNCSHHIPAKFLEPKNNYPSEHICIDCLENSFNGRDMVWAKEKVLQGVPAAESDVYSAELTLFGDMAEDWWDYKSKIGVKPNGDYVG